MHVGHPVIRALRAAVFTAVCVLASAALHVLVGGGGMRPGGLAAAMAAIWAGAYLLAGRRREWPELLALCAVSQYGLHQLFAGSSPVSPVSSGHHHRPGPLAQPFGGDVHSGEFSRHFGELSRAATRLRAAALLVAGGGHPGRRHVGAARMVVGGAGGDPRGRRGRRPRRTPQAPPRPRLIAVDRRGSPWIGVPSPLAAG
ncbi:hypothetical protein ABT120_43085 [Nonomuraea angiospora]|uniref:hypothetical protein n=1 Tax=Nonomuraea angiospora TaxID=46172 RepID=UPI003333B1DA